MTLLWLRRTHVLNEALLDGAKAQFVFTDPPYNVAIVQLEEGPYLVTNILGCNAEELRIGMPLEVVFEDIDESISLAKFRPCTTE